MRLVHGGSQGRGLGLEGGIVVPLRDHGGVEAVLLPVGVNEEVGRVAPARGRRDDGLVVAAGLQGRDPRRPLLLVLPVHHLQVVVVVIISVLATVVVQVQVEVVVVRASTWLDSRWMMGTPAGWTRGRLAVVLGMVFRNST